MVRVRGCGCEANGLFTSVGGTNGPFASFPVVRVRGCGCEANGLFTSLGGTNGPFASFPLVWVRGCGCEANGLFTSVGGTNSPFASFPVVWVRGYWCEANGLFTSVGETVRSLRSDGLLEGTNSLIQAAKARARGYRNKNKMIIIAYLIAGKLPLPTVNDSAVA